MVNESGDGYDKKLTEVMMLLLICLLAYCVSMMAKGMLRCDNKEHFDQSISINDQ